MATPMPLTINDGVGGIPAALIFAQRQRQEQMKTAWQAYRGEWGPGPLRVEGNQPDDNVRVNRCAPIVDKGVSFLFGQAVDLRVEDADGGTDGAASGMHSWLRDAWGDADDKMTVLSKLAMNGAICGQAFLKIIPANKRAGDVYPRLVVLDPQTVTVQTDPDDCENVRTFCIEYDSYDPASGAALARRQIITRDDPDGLAAQSGDGLDTDETWRITNYARSGVGGVWQPTGDAVRWPYPFPPIVTCQNLPNPNEFWGLPDLTPDLVAMNRMLNFVESNTSRIIKMHASPWAWASGVDMKVLTVEPGRVIGLPHPESKMGFLEVSADGLTASMNFANDLRGNMDEQSRVPAVALGRLTDLPKGNISGVALQLLFQPLIEKTILKQRLYGRLLREASRAMLILGGFPAALVYQAQIAPHWQNLLPVDDLAAAQTALALQQVGVSRQTILAELGYDPDAEAEKQQEDATTQVTNYAHGQGLPPAADAHARPQREAQPNVNAPQAPDATDAQGQA